MLGLLIAWNQPRSPQMRRAMRKRGERNAVGLKKPIANAYNLGGLRLGFVWQRIVKPLEYSKGL